jgi:hypothetical protein
LNTYSCGNVTEETGAHCARCAALRALDLKPGATREEIKRAYRALAKVWHPDRFDRYKQIRAKAEEKQKTINAAYSFLMKNCVHPGRDPRRERRPPWAEGVKTPRPPRWTETPREHRQHEPDWRETVKRRGILPRRFFNIPLPVVLGCGALISAVAVGWLLLKPLDAALESNPKTAMLDEEFKASAGGTLGEFRQRMRDVAESILNHPMPQRSIAIRAPSEPAEKLRFTRTQSSRAHAPGVQDDQRGPPYIMAGMTRSKVIAIEGNPSDATEEMLVYGRSELYFNNGQLIGWKIDPASSPIRVKLLPDASFDPDLNFIAVGSTKNEVIKIEGTPTFFSQNIFGYGRSEVYFKDNRVASWKDDPSRPLHTDKR